MDVPAADFLESVSHARHGHARNVYPELSRQQTVFEYVGAAEAAAMLNKRKSLRLRPTESFEQQDAAPLQPLRNPKSQPDLRSRASSKMSLFSLFSKPKVEKHRGAAELAWNPAPLSAGSGSHKELTGPAIGVDNEPIEPRPRTSRSQSRSGYRMKSRDPPPPVPAIPNDQKLRPLEALPLFQIWPQAIRHGFFQSSTWTSQELLPHKQRSSNVPDESTDRSQESNGDGTSGADATGPVPASLKHGSSASRTEDSHDKLFILVTSGCLLQYAATGSSERMPEKILQLGKDSAAYASDSIPGRHFVLEVSQAVDANGESVAGSSSIFSRLTIRSAAARRATAKLLIVMPGATEMEEWMAAIRTEIHAHGGKQTHSSSSAMRAESRIGDVAKHTDAPSQMRQMHRYQVKRDPSRVVSVVFQDDNVFDLLSDRDMQISRRHPEVETSQDTAVEIVDSESGHMDDRPRAASDAESTASSTAHSMGQQSLDKLRDSTRVSHTSTATTLTNTSRTNSMTLDQPKTPSESMSNRNVSSYSLAKRRSAVPIAINDVSSRTGAALTSPSPPKRVSSIGLSAPAVRPPSADRIHPSLIRLSMAQSAPFVDRNGRREFKKSSSDGSKRPESILGDLPNPTSWANRGSAAGWSASSQHSVTERNPQRHSSRASTDSVVPTLSSTRSSRSFSIPLRINTTVIPDPNAIECMTISSEAVNSAVRFPDVVTRPDSQMSGRSTPVDSTSRRDASSGRLSLFPSSTPPLGAGPSAPTQQPRLSVATNMLHEHAPASSRLRPSSVQARADHDAAHRESAQSHPKSAHPTSEPQYFPIMAPTRQLRMTRSIAAMERTTPTVSESEFHSQPPQHFNFTTRRLVDDHHRPLYSQFHVTHMRSSSPSRPATSNVSFPPTSALPTSRPSSRSSRRLTRDHPPQHTETRRSVSLAPNMHMPVRIDLSLPMLPPPAPPPSAPLPALPPSARSSSRPSERAKSPELLGPLRERSGNEIRPSPLGQALLKRFVPGTPLGEAIGARLAQNSKVAAEPECHEIDPGQDGAVAPIPQTVPATALGIEVAAA
ncbi:unnamed protein product [Zymoseptoria tritici ST99CH_1E4]|uniref:PH domain-containing protein n=1 Tax=Zymoseptoria tritici ST99CH_1E4 TaxID=1276532 RepID=A0A2H1FX18_ZYMTR|nr:unnamed protein product [Zymoseptoria tritici ST99CH_1E4]